MSKGKYKRKKKHAQEKAKEKAAKIMLMPGKEAEADNQGKATTDRTQKAADDKNPPWYVRLKEWAKDGKTFTDWCIAAFTLVLAGAAIYQFIIMGGQLDVMRKDQRAWIAIVQKTGTVIELDKPPSTSVAITDTGKTPAINVVAHMFIEIVPNGSNPHFDEPLMHNIMTIGAMPPNSPQEGTVIRRRFKIGGGADESEDYPLTADERTALDEGRAWIAVHGVVWYDDIFKVRHWIKFCVWSDLKPGTYSARACTNYNSVDGD